MGYQKNKTTNLNSVRTKTQFKEIQGSFLRTLAKLISLKEFPGEGKKIKEFQGVFEEVCQL